MVAEVVVVVGVMGEGNGGGEYWMMVVGVVGEEPVDSVG